MSTAKIVFSDRADGRVRVRVVFEPAIDMDDQANTTPAQKACLSMLDPYPQQGDEKSNTCNVVLPNAVRQTKPTNCFQACVAIVLGVPIDDVPDACDGASWDWDAFQDWLAGRGLQAIEIGFGNGGTIYPVRKPVPCIVTGQSPRECVTGRHAVVGELLGLEGFRLLHDPHPSDLWIDGEPTHAVFFVPLQLALTPSVTRADVGAERNGA